MKHRAATLIIVLGIVLVGPAWPAAAPDKAELSAMRERIERLKRDLAQKEQTRVESADQLRESEQAISEANRTLRELAARQAALKGELRSIAQQTRRLEGEIAARDRDLERVIYARYLNGTVDTTRILLSGGDPQAVARELHYYGYISAAHAQTAQALRAALEELAALARRANERGAEIAALEARERTERGRIQEQRRERQTLLGKLAAEIRSSRREIDTLQRNEQRLTRLVESLAQMIRERPAAPATPRRPKDKVPEGADSGSVFSGLLDTMRGRLRLPVRGQLVNRFGTPRSDSGLTWKGLFIRADEGAEVTAVAEGRVVFADWMRGFGNLLILDHGKGFLTIYGNNESLLKQPGEIVRSGESIATVGHSGGNEDSGLYFEVRHQGRAIDPMPWITTR